MLFCNAIVDKIQTNLNASKHGKNRLHIGSTAVDGLSAKSVIDILFGLESVGELDEIVDPLLKAGYIYYQVYNVMKPNRFFL